MHTANPFEHARSGLAARICAAAALVIALAAVSASAQSPDGNAAAGKAREHWAAMAIDKAVAEWQEALRVDPSNEDARAALSRISTALGRGDELLAAAERLADGGFTAEAGELLDGWEPALSTPDQRARVFVVRGLIRLGPDGDATEAHAQFSAAEQTAASQSLKLRARLGRGQALLASGGTAEGMSLLRGVAAEQGFPETSSEAAWSILAAGRESGPARIEALGAFLRQYAGTKRARKAHLMLASQLEQQRGCPGSESYAELIAASAMPGTLAEKSASAEAIAAAIASGQSAEDLGKLAEGLAALPDDWDVGRPPAELAALCHERMASIGTGQAAVTAARALQAAGGRLVERGPSDARRDRWEELAARGALMEGQLLLMGGDEAAAMSALARASAVYRTRLCRGNRAAGAVLLRIGRMFESRGRPDAAVAHYEVTAHALAADELGAEALWRLALVCRDRLDRPFEALRALKRYHDLYPPSFRVPTSAGERIRKLGYADVASFQAAHGLKPDGVVGSQTIEELKSEEENFCEILPREVAAKSVTGRPVNDEIFKLASSLDARGRCREAVLAYQEFLAMYPGHNLGDNALIAIARILRANDLFPEAVAAYERLMADYPEGEETSHAYLDAAYCHECMGQWKKALDLYDMFVKKFPQYTRAPEAVKKLAAARQLARYAELLDDPKLPDAKRADALYEMGKILYKDIGNRQKAVEIFTAVADRYPASYQAADARFTAGVCLLREENFEAARAAFGKLIAAFPQSRLADDAQFWIGHTWEYQARALGELDLQRIVLKQRTAAQSERLRGDLELRRKFWAQAAAPAVAWHEPHPDIAGEGATHEKVREDFRRGIEAYRKTVDNYRLGDMAQRALLRIGTIHSDYLHDLDRAIEAYRELMEKYPGSPEAVDAQFAVGRHFLEKGDLAKAEKAVMLFLAGFPNHEKAAEALLDLAECHMKQNDWMKALDDLQSYLSRYPEGPEAKNVTEKIAWIKKYRF